MKMIENLSALKSLEGEALPSSDWLTISQDQVNIFADATLDHQWIHVDVEKAKQHSPFGGPIAHGFLTLSLIPKMFEEVLKVKSVRMGINYGLNKVRFINPVPVGAKVKLESKIANVDMKSENSALMTIAGSVTIDGAEKPACVVEFLTMLFE